MKKATLLQKNCQIANCSYLCLANYWNMSKKKLFYIGFFVVLALAFYFILTLVIPGYGDRKVNSGELCKAFFIYKSGWNDK